MLKLGGAVGVKIACPLFEGIGWDSGFARRIRGRRAR